MRLALSVAAGILASGILVCAAQAQSAPPVAPPYYIISADENSLILAAGGSAQRSGGFAEITVIMGSAPDRLAQNGIARLDMGYRFNCAEATHATPVAAGYDVNGGLMGVIADDVDWEAVNPQAPSATIMALACDGVVPQDTDIDGTPDQIIALYRQWVSEDM